MTKKRTLTFIIIALVIFFVSLGYSITKYNLQNLPFLENIPLISPKTPNPTKLITPTITSIPGVPRQTNLDEATKSSDVKKALEQKYKILDYLPIRIANFPTTVGIDTTINIYYLLYDPESVIRLEIYGINYNLPDQNGPNAIAFKESFAEAKRQLERVGANVKDLQIIYGNRQYIQTTATNWVKIFKLL